MASCKKYHALIAAQWFGDLTTDEDRTLRAHLQTCRACREALGASAETIARIGKPATPDLPQHFWEGYWARLAKRMETDEAPRRSAFRARILSILQAPWSPALRLSAAAAIFVAGVLATRVFWTPEKVSESELTRAAPPHAHLAQASAGFAELLSRSKVLLIGFANLDPEAVNAGEFDFSTKRQVSRQLIAEAVAFRNDPGATKDQQLLQLINQLEMVLLQIANLEAEHDVEAVELVRSSIDREGLLLKINIEEMKRLAAQAASASVPSL